MSEPSHAQDDHLHMSWAEVEQRLRGFAAISTYRSENPTIWGSLKSFLSAFRRPTEASNARLFAAAPDLLSALAAAVDCLATGDPAQEHPQVDRVLALARAAIAKASGKAVQR